MTWTAPRTWGSADALTSSLFNTHVRDNSLHLYNRHQVTRSTSDTAQVTTGTYSAPNGFGALTVNSGLTYRFSVIGIYSVSVVTVGLQTKFTYPTLTAGLVYPVVATTSTAISTAGTQALPVSPATVTSSVAGTTSGVGFQIEGFFTASASGTFAFSFTPSTAGTLTIRNNTYMSLVEVG